MKSKHKISLIIGVALAANLAFASSALAQSIQAPATVTPAQSRLTQALEAKAQTSVAECRTFRDNVYNVFNQKAKAIWGVKVVVGAVVRDSTTITQTQGCYMVPASYPDYLDGAMTQPSTTSSVGIYGDPTKIPAEYANLQAQIKNGQGISSQAVAQAEAKYKQNQESTGFISQIFGSALVWLGSVLAAFLGGLMVLAGSIFDSAVWHTLTVTEAPLVVKIGWSVMRDISNMFFILIMIIMALAAILRLEEYDYRHLMGEVIIMAILVNFSQVIAVTIMNFVNYIGAIFYSGGFGVDIFKTMVLIVNPVNDMTTVMQGGVPAALVLVLGKLVFLAVGTAVFGILATMFVLRIVGLYVLIIFSPLAYVLDILPSTKNFAHEWWHKFIHYLIWVPVSLFMIRLVIVVVKAKDATAGGTIAGLITTPGADSAFYYFVLCAFIAASFVVAEHAGMVGSHAIVHAAEKGAHWLGHRGMHYAGRKYNEWSTHKFANPGVGKKLTTADRVKFALVNPVAAFKGWEARGEELSHHAQHIAQARGREAIDALMTGSTMPWAQYADRAAVNEKLKNYLNMSKEQIMARAVEIEDLEGHEGENERLALMKAAFSNGFQDDVMSMGQFAKQYADEDGSISSATAINRFLYGYLGGDHGVNEQAMAFMAVDLDEISRKTKHPEYMGHAKFNPDTGAFERGMEVVGHKDLTRNGQNVEGGFEELKNTWQAKYMAGEWNKMVIRDRIAISPHVLWTQSIRTNDKGDLVDAKGQPITNGFIEDQKYGRKNGELDEAQRAAFGLFMGTSGEIHHIQGRHANWAFPGHVDQNTGEYIADSLDSILSLENGWAENSLPIKAFYSVAIGKNPRDHIKEVTGIKAAYFNEKGEKVYRNIGDPGNKMLVTETVVNEVRGNKKIVENVKKESIEKIDQVVKEVTPAVYMGEISTANLEGVLAEKLSSFADVVGEKISILASEINNTINAESISKYNPRPALAGIDTKIGKGEFRFSTSDMRALTKAISAGYSKAISSIRVNNYNMNDVAPGGGREKALQEMEKEFRASLDERDASGNYVHNENMRSITAAEINQLSKEALP